MFKLFAKLKKCLNRTQNKGRLSLVFLRQNYSKKVFGRRFLGVCSIVFLILGSSVIVYNLQDYFRKNINDAEAATTVFTEDFSDNVYEDTVNTTGNWDTVANLGAVHNYVWTDPADTETIGSTVNGSLKVAVPYDILRVHTDGTPYMVYNDNATNAAFVSYWNGSDWSGLANTGAGYDDVSGGNQADAISMYLDNDGYPYVLWNDASDNILLTRWDGSKWAQMDGTAGYETVATATAGAFMALDFFKIDSSNQPNMVWYDNGDVFYTYWDGSQWAKLGSGGGAGQDELGNTSASNSYSHLALYSDRPYVLYTSDDSDDYWFTYWDGSQWAKLGSGGGAGYENISSFTSAVSFTQSYMSKIIIDSTGTVNFIYPGNYTSDTENEIWATYWDGSQWAKRSDGTAGADNVSKTYLGSNLGSTTYYIGAVLDSNNYPQVAWCEKDPAGVGGGCNKLYYSHWDGGGWHGLRDTSAGKDLLSIYDSTIAGHGYNYLKVDSNDNPIIFTTVTRSGSTSASIIIGKDNNWYNASAETLGFETIIGSGTNEYSLGLEVVNDVIYVAGLDVSSGTVLKYAQADNTKYNPSSVLQSKTIDITDNNIIYATLTATTTIPETTSISYQMSVDGGSNWEDVISGTAHLFTNSGSDLRWKATLSTTDNTQTPTISDIQISYSDDYLTLFSPNGGETFVAGATEGVRWQTNRTGTTVTLEYSDDNGGSWTEIANSVDIADKTYPWTVPVTTGTQYLVRITDSDVAALTDTSASNFEVIDGLVGTINYNDDSYSLSNSDFIQIDSGRAELISEMGDGTESSSIEFKYANEDFFIQEDANSGTDFTKGDVVMLNGFGTNYVWDQGDIWGIRISGGNDIYRFITYDDGETYVRTLPYVLPDSQSNLNFAIDSEGNLWFAHSVTNGFSKLEAPDYTRQTTYSASSAVAAVAVDQDDKVWYADSTNNQLKKFNPSSELDEVTVSSTVTRLLVNQFNDVYVTSDATGQNIRCYDSSGNTCDSVDTPAGNLYNRSFSFDLMGNVLSAHTSAALGENYFQIYNISEDEYTIINSIYDTTANDIGSDIKVNLSGDIIAITGNYGDGLQYIDMSQNYNLSKVSDGDLSTTDAMDKTIATNKYNDTFIFEYEDDILRRLQYNDYQDYTLDTLLSSNTGIASFNNSDATGFHNALINSDYPTAQGYYVTTTDLSQVDVSSIIAIDQVEIDQISDEDATFIKYLFSFNGRSTWKYWDGAEWVASSLEDINVDGNDEFTIESLTADEWEADGGFEAGVTETIDVAAELSTTDAVYSPLLEKITFYYPETYTKLIPQVINNTGIEYNQLLSFSQLTGANHQADITDLHYQLSNNGNDWYYYSSGWVTAADSFIQANTWSDINDNISTFDTEVGTGTLYVKTFLNSDGLNQVSLDNINIGYLSLILETYDSGTTWIAGTNQKIHWTDTRGNVGNVLLEYYDGSSWNTIVAATDNDGEYEFTVPNISITDFKIRITDTLNSINTSTSNDISIVKSKTVQSYTFGTDVYTESDGSKITIDTGNEVAKLVTNAGSGSQTDSSMNISYNDLALWTPEDNNITYDNGSFRLKELFGYMYTYHEKWFFVAKDSDILETNGALGDIAYRDSTVYFAPEEAGFAGGNKTKIAMDDDGNMWVAGADDSSGVIIKRYVVADREVGAYDLSFNLGSGSCYVTGLVADPNYLVWVSYTNGTDSYLYSIDLDTETETLEATESAKIISDIVIDKNGDIFAAYYDGSYNTGILELDSGSFDSLQSSTASANDSREISLAVDYNNDILGIFNDTIVYLDNSNNYSITEYDKNSVFSDITQVDLLIDNFNNIAAVVDDSLYQIDRAGNILNTVSLETSSNSIGLTIENSIWLASQSSSEIIEFILEDGVYSDSGNRYFVKDNNVQNSGDSTGYKYSQVLSEFDDTSSYYVTNSDVGRIDVSKWGTIDSVAVDEYTPDGTEIEYLVSFDGGSTWRYFNGSVWVQVDIDTELETYGMSSATLEGLSSANWEADGGFDSGTTNYIGFAANLNTSDVMITPTFDGVVFTYTPTYTTDEVTITNETGLPYFTLQAFNTTDSASSEGGIKYQLSPDDGSNWYYVTGGSWTSGASGYDQANTAAEINTALTDFNNDYPNGTLKWRAVFKSTGGIQPTELENVMVGYQDFLINPIGNETYVTGATETIIWNTVYTVGSQVTVQYYNGSTWVDIDCDGLAGQPTDNDGRCQWVIPNLNISNAAVKVTSVTSPSLTVTSENFNIINTPDTYKSFDFSSAGDYNVPVTWNSAVSVNTSGGLVQLKSLASGLSLSESLDLAYSGKYHLYDSSNSQISSSTIALTPTVTAGVGNTVYDNGDMFTTSIEDANLKWYDASEDTVNTISFTYSYGETPPGGIGAYGSAPFDVAMDQDGNVYVLLAVEKKIAKLLPANNFAYTAGSIGSGGSDIDLTGVANLLAPLDIEIEIDGDIWISDFNAQRIWHIDGSTYTTTEYSPGFGPAGMLLDHFGNLILTENNGSGMKIYTAASGFTSSKDLTLNGSAYVSRMIYVDKYNDIWIPNDGDLDRFDYSNGYAITTYDLQDDGGVPAGLGDIRDMLLDDNDYLWVAAGDNNDIYCYDNPPTYDSHCPYTLPSLSYIDPFRLHIDSDDNIWILSEDQVTGNDAPARLICLDASASYGSYCSSTGTGLAMNDKFWQDNSNLNGYDNSFGSGHLEMQRQTYGYDHYLSGDVWFVNDEGEVKNIDGITQVISTYTPTTSLGTTSLRSIKSVVDGDIWITDLDNTQVIRLDASNSYAEHLSSPYAVPLTGGDQKIVQDQLGNIFVGDNDHIYMADSNAIAMRDLTDSRFNHIQDIEVDKYGYVWAINTSTNPNLFKVDPSQADDDIVIGAYQTGSTAYSFTIDNNSEYIWVANTFATQLTCLNYDDPTTYCDFSGEGGRNYDPSSDGPLDLSTLGYVNDVIVDSNNDVWVLSYIVLSPFSYGKYIKCLDSSNGYNNCTGSGFVDGVVTLDPEGIYALAPDKDNNIWVSFPYASTTQQIQCFTAADPTTSCSNQPFTGLGGLSTVTNNMTGYNMAKISLASSQTTYPTTAKAVRTTVFSQFKTIDWIDLYDSSDSQPLDVTTSEVVNTSVKWLVSFDNRDTWKYWSGSQWDEATGADVETQLTNNGMSSSAIEALTNTQWNHASGFNSSAGTTATIDFAIQLLSSNSSTGPSVSGVEMKYRTKTYQGSNNPPYIETSGTVAVGNRLVYENLYSFSETVGSNNDGSVEYQIGFQENDTAEIAWYYWSGAAWTGSSEPPVYPTETNTAIEINQNIASFDDTRTNGYLHFRAFMVEGSMAELENINVGYDGGVVTNEPDAPVIVGGTAQDQNTIQWEFQTSASATGYALYEIVGQKDPAGGESDDREIVRQLTASFGTNGANLTYDEGSLTTNTAYGDRYVIAYNDSGDSDASTTYSDVYTWIEKPTTLQSTNTASTSITLQALHSGTSTSFTNLGTGSSYLHFENITTGATLNTSATGTNSVEFTGLNAGTTYQFRVKAQNADGIEATVVADPWSATVSITTTSASLPEPDNPPPATSPTIAASLQVAVIDNGGVQGAFISKSLYETISNTLGTYLENKGLEAHEALRIVNLVDNFVEVGLIIIFVIFLFYLYQIISHLSRGDAKECQLVCKAKLLPRVLVSKPENLFIRSVKQLEDGTYNISYSEYKAMHYRFNQAMGAVILLFVLKVVVIGGLGYIFSTKLASEIFAQASYGSGNEIVQINDSLSYKVNFSNTGTGAATNFVITDILDAELTYEASGSAVYINDVLQPGIVLSANGQTISINVGNLAAGASGYALIQGNVTDAGNAVITNQANIGGSNFADINTNTITNYVESSVAEAVTTFPEGIYEPYCESGGQRVNCETGGRLYGTHLSTIKIPYQGLAAGSGNLSCTIRMSNSTNKTVSSSYTVNEGGVANLDYRLQSTDSINKSVPWEIVECSYTPNGGSKTILSGAAGRKILVHPNTWTTVRSSTEDAKLGLDCYAGGTNKYFANTSDCDFVGDVSFAMAMASNTEIEGWCSDGQDNDGNGVADCSDTMCRGIGYPTCSGYQGSILASGGEKCAGNVCTGSVSVSGKTITYKYTQHVKPNGKLKVMFGNGSVSSSSGGISNYIANGPVFSTYGKYAQDGASVLPNDEILPSGSPVTYQTQADSINAIVNQVMWVQYSNLNTSSSQGFEILATYDGNIGKVSGLSLYGDNGAPSNDDESESLSGLGITGYSCGDGVDNDLDYKADCLDVQCNGKLAAAGKYCEYGTETTCNDGYDNDGDGKTDCADQDCDGKQGNGGICQYGNESGATNCQDSFDNDADGKTDCHDQTTCWKVSASGCAATETSCSDGIDNDLDSNYSNSYDSDPNTGVDCTDYDCYQNPACPSTENQQGDDKCFDGIDNDLDGNIDCYDSDCAGVEYNGQGCYAQEFVIGVTNMCRDNTDNDADAPTGKVDCTDNQKNREDGNSVATNISDLSNTDCWAAFDICGPCPSNEFISYDACADGIDNDYDNGAGVYETGAGGRDCADSDCTGKLANYTGAVCQATESSCSDGFDNDNDGNTDCQDNNCAGKTGPKGQTCETAENNCSDGYDNDGDGYRDCLDPNCYGKSSCSLKNWTETSSCLNIPNTTSLVSIVSNGTVRYQHKNRLHLNDPYTIRFYGSATDYKNIDIFVGQGSFPFTPSSCNLAGDTSKISMNTVSGGLRLSKNPGYGSGLVSTFDVTVTCSTAGNSAGFSASYPISVSVERSGSNFEVGGLSPNPSLVIYENQAPTVSKVEVEGDVAGITNVTYGYPLRLRGVPSDGATGNSGICGCEFDVNGSLGTSSSNCIYTLNNRTSDGSYTVKVKAIDGADNKGASLTKTFTLNVKPKEINYSKLNRAYYNNSNSSLSTGSIGFQTSANGSFSSCTARVKDISNATVKTQELSKNGTSSITCSGTIDLSGLADGKYILETTATDEDSDTAVSKKIFYICNNSSSIGCERMDMDNDGIPENTYTTIYGSSMSCDSCPDQINSGSDVDGDGIDDVCDGIANKCGNGTQDAGEDCDDGNQTNGDGCSATCTLEVTICGNGLQEVGEACDDGNTDNGDGCSSICTLEVEPICGNNSLETGEECDDGNTTSGDGCSATCIVETPVCGNNLVEQGEGCDDGNTQDGDGCSATCQAEAAAVCGNNILEAGESCDDGNTSDGDGCSSTCQTETAAPVCGNNVIESGEECDDGNTTDGDGCSSVCVSEGGVACGNGLLEVGETCDDGNTTDGDGCSSTCQTEAAGDQILTAPVITQVQLVSKDIYEVPEWQEVKGNWLGNVAQAQTNGDDYYDDNYYEGEYYPDENYDENYQEPTKKVATAGIYVKGTASATTNQIRITINSTPKTITFTPSDPTNWETTITDTFDLGTHTVTAVAIDATGNISPSSDPKTISIVEDTVAQEVAKAAAEAVVEVTKKAAEVPEAILEVGDQDLVDVLPEPVEKIFKAIGETEFIKNIAKNKTIETLNRTIFNNEDIEEAIQKVVGPAVFAVAVAQTLPAIGVTSLSLLPYLHLLFVEPFALLFRRKRKKFGIIYDALTKKPVDLAVVRLFEAETNKLVQTKVTDREGRYLIIAKNPGKYYIQVTKPGFLYPTKYLKDKKEDFKYLDIYHGERIEVTSQNAVITVNIPLDAKEKALVPDKKVISGFFKKRFQQTLSIVGVVLTLVGFIIKPSVLLFGFLLIHIATYVLFKRLAVPKKPKNYGIIYDEENKVPLRNAVVRIFDNEYNKLLETQVTDAKGRYNFLVGNNVYYVVAEKDGYRPEKITPIDMSKKDDNEVVDVDIGLEKLG